MSFRKLLFIGTLFISARGPAQNFHKTPVGNSGCSLYVFCDISFSSALSPDSSMVYTGECKKEDVNWGIICVKLTNPLSDLSQAEELLVNYLDYLKTNFEITQSVGYGKGHRLNKDENTRGIIDYWEDADKNNWKVKGWTDGKYLGVLYAFSLKELPETKVNLYLDGFRLPGMK